MSKRIARKITVKRKGRKEDQIEQTTECGSATQITSPQTGGTAGTVMYAVLFLLAGFVSVLCQ